MKGPLSVSVVHDPASRARHALRLAIVEILSSNIRTVGRLEDVPIATLGNFAEIEMRYEYLC